MSNVTHTPGPWVDGRTADSIVTKNYSPPDSLAGSLFEFYGGLPIAESVAANNKPLIKAAPDLLAVCEDIKKYLDFVSSGQPTHGTVERELYYRLQAAIAAAKGEA